MTNIVLLAEPGTGKTTIAQAYSELVGGKVMAFKDEMLLEIAWALAAGDARDHISRNAFATKVLVKHYLMEMQNPATKDKYRAIQQAWGTDYRRAQDENYWVKKFVAKYENRPQLTPVANDDCRFPNEQKALRNLGFKFVKLESGETTRPLTGERANHESEKYWRKFKADLTLSYEAGPVLQAKRIYDYFNAPAEQEVVIVDSVS